MTTPTTTYANKAAAVRGAKRAGFTDFTVERNDAGRWTVTPKKTRVRLSTTDSPVALIWHWLSQDDHAKLSRADAIKALGALGVASGTVSTQRQRFLVASPAERKARAARHVPATPVASDPPRMRRATLNEFEIADRLRNLGHRVTLVRAACGDVGAVIELDNGWQVWITGSEMCVLFLHEGRTHISPNETQIRIIDRHLRATDVAARKWPIAVWS